MVYQTKTGFIKTVEDYLNEYICLRLTQNFQLINASPSSKIEYGNVLMRKDDIKMGMGNKFNVLTA
jgi:hypothetical protein